MHNRLSDSDKAFRDRVESCEISAADFNHRAHLRLAYAYLVENSASDSTERMRKAIVGLLEHAGVEPAEKFHETMTEAWILAVQHFMRKNASARSFHEFIESNGELLDAEIMLTHYSSAVLFSEQARRSFVEPDLDPIPTHGK